jgi:tetratricopeptide (TPR) repeat protein
VNSTLKVFGQRAGIVLALVGGFYLTLHSAQYSTWHKDRLYRQLLRGNPQEKLMAASALAHFGAEEQLLAGLKADIPEVRHLSREALECLWFREAGSRARQTLEDAFQASEKQDFKTALRILDRLVQKFPRYAEAWNRRASVYWQMGEYEKSIADCEKALALNPNHYGAWQGIGVCRVQLGDIAEACRCLRAALKISPFDETTRHCLEKCEELLRVMRGKESARVAGEMI